MIPLLLSKRYELIQDLDTTRELLDVIRESGLEPRDVQIITEKIKSLEEELSRTESEAEELIERMGSTRARLFASMHYQCGYRWAEIAGIFGQSEEAVKGCVYAALRSMQITRLDYCDPK